MIDKEAMLYNYFNIENLMECRLCGFLWDKRTTSHICSRKQDYDEVLNLIDFKIRLLEDRRNKLKNARV